PRPGRRTLVKASRRSAAGFRRHRLLQTRLERERPRCVDSKWNGSDARVPQHQRRRRQCNCRMDRVASAAIRRSEGTAVMDCPKTASRTLLLCAMVVLVPLAGCQQPQEAGSVRAEARPEFGGDFTLTNQNNQTFRLQDVRGRPVVLFFGYTSCPDM